MTSDDKFELTFTTSRTTYLQDYRRYHGSYKANTVIPDYSRRKFEETITKSTPPKIVDQESFIPLKKKLLMNLMIYPHEINGTNPHEEIGHTVLPEDEKKKDAIRTRPRVSCSPQVSPDEVSDQEMKKLLLDYTYTTDFRKTEQELLSMMKLEERSVPRTVLEHDHFLPKTNKHYFSVSFKPKPVIAELTPELNMKVQKQTNNQLIGITNRNELFWKDKEVICGACYNPLSTILCEETKNKIRQLVKTNSLRMPHDKKCHGYAGFSPEIATGIDLARKDLPCTHPLLSTSQAITQKNISDCDTPKLN